MAPQVRIYAQPRGSDVVGQLLHPDTAWQFAMWAAEEDGGSQAVHLDRVSLSEVDGERIVNLIFSYDPWNGSQPKAVA